MNRTASLPLALFVPISILFAPHAGAVDEIAANSRSHERLPDVRPTERDWPWWRGPASDGIAVPQAVPIDLSRPQVKRWAAAIPGRGHASPIVWGEQLFVFTATETDGTFHLLAFDRAAGRSRWQTKLQSGTLAKKVHKANSHASATPACDGERVFCVYVLDGQLWVTAVDLAGDIVWKTAVGAFDSIYGFGMSPAIHGSLVIVNGDNDQTGAFVAAVHRKSGQIVWRIKRPDVDTYCTPIVTRVAGRQQLLLGGSGFTAGYDPLTGGLLWRCDGPTAETTANSVAFDRDHVYVSGGYPKPYTGMKVRADGTGDVTATHRLWTATRGMPYVPSLLYADGLLYSVDDNGVATCYDAETGKPAWTKRLGGDFSSSPVLCGDKLFVVSEQGIAYVLRPSRTFELLAKTDLGSGVMATPTICGGRILIRTERELLCFGE